MLLLNDRVSKFKVPLLVYLCPLSLFFVQYKTQKTISMFKFNVTGFLSILVTLLSSLLFNTFTVIIQLQKLVRNNMVGKREE